MLSHECFPRRGSHTKRQADDDAAAWHDGSVEPHPFQHGTGPGKHEKLRRILFRALVGHVKGLPVLGNHLSR